MTEQANKQIVIVGGGSAGWMTAASLANNFAHQPVSITLIESPSIGIIGVGEGSTPHLKRYFDSLSISEEDWMPFCHATYKTGISFIDWTEHLNENRYFHPFPSPVDRQTASLFLHNVIARHKSGKTPFNPDHYFLTYDLAKNNLSPITKPNKPKIPLNYAYHFDSHLVGEFLQKYAVQNGVTHIQADVINVVTNEDGVKNLQLEDNQTVHGDLFFDASGFRSILSSKALNTEFVSFEDNLFNNRAIAVASSKQTELSPQTIAAAMSTGWRWQIPLTHRTGNGYVYCDRYLDRDDAKEEILSSLNLPLSTPVRDISMRVGRSASPWNKNVISVGLSQGFIEPLEATALHLVMDTINAFITTVDLQDLEKSNRSKFNSHIIERYEGIRDYIVAHYKMNTRTDSQYWIDNRENTVISERLKEVLSTWQTGKDITPVLQENGMLAHYPAISWYCLLSGYGAFANTQISTKIDPRFNQMRAFIEKFSSHFESHIDLMKAQSESIVVDEV